MIAYLLWRRALTRGELLSGSSSFSFFVALPELLLLDEVTFSSFFAFAPFLPNSKPFADFFSFTYVSSSRLSFFVVSARKPLPQTFFSKSSICFSIRFCSATMSLSVSQ